MIHIAIVEDETIYIKQLSEYMEQFRKEFSQEMKLWKNTNRNMTLF